MRLGFSARHYGISVVVLTQQLTSISKPFRENIAKLVMFYNASREDMDMLFKKYIGDVSTQGRQQILQLLKGHKHAHLDVLLRYPYSHEVVTPRLQWSLQNFHLIGEGNFLGYLVLDAI